MRSRKLKRFSFSKAPENIEIKKDSKKSNPFSALVSPINNDIKNTPFISNTEVNNYLSDFPEGRDCDEQLKNFEPIDLS